MEAPNFVFEIKNDFLYILEENFVSTSRNKITPCRNLLLVYFKTSWSFYT